MMSGLVTPIYDLTGGDCAVRTVQPVQVSGHRQAADTDQSHYIRYIRRDDCHYTRSVKRLIP